MARKDFPPAVSRKPARGTLSNSSTGRSIHDYLAELPKNPGTHVAPRSRSTSTARPDFTAPAPSSSPNCLPDCRLATTRLNMGNDAPRSFCKASTTGPLYSTGSTSIPIRTPALFRHGIAKQSLQGYLSKGILQLQTSRHGHDAYPLSSQPLRASERTASERTVRKCEPTARTGGHHPPKYTASEL